MATSENTKAIESYQKKLNETETDALFLSCDDDSARSVMFSGMLKLNNHSS